MRCVISQQANPDYAGARRYALERLERDLSPDLTYHSISHTRDHVVPSAERYAEMEGFKGDDAMLLSTAAWFHDLGYLERHENNEVIAVRMVQETLPALGFSAPQIEVISGIIMATHLPQNPQNTLEACMADADLDTLGGDEFLELEAALRTELATFGAVYTDVAWYKYQLEFLQQHQYFTASARRLRNAGKRANIETVEALLADAQKREG